MTGAEPIRGFERDTARILFQPWPTDDAGADRHFQPRLLLISLTILQNLVQGRRFTIRFGIRNKTSFVPGNNTLGGPKSYLRARHEQVSGEVVCCSLCSPVEAGWGAL